MLNRELYQKIFMETSTSYWSRVDQMMKICGPISWPSLFYSNTSILEAKALIQESKLGKQTAIQEPKRLEFALYLTNASLHPDTGEIIPLPFRMAAHVPVNAVLLCGMLSSRTVFSTGLWQFLNQSFNALQFYYNRNASSETASDNKVLIASFLGAVTGSVGVGVLLRQAAIRSDLIARQSVGPSRSSLLRSAVFFSNSIPFFAAAAGKPLQISLMRQREINEGVEVFDQEGISKGKSKIAGRFAVTTTILTRTLYLAPMLWIPFFQSAFEKRFTILQSSQRAKIVFYTFHCAFNSAFVTPLCIALFDQQASLPVEFMESDYHNLYHNGGKQIERLYFNKGL